jgi:hypothetical protein
MKKTRPININTVKNSVDETTTSLDMASDGRWGNGGEGRHWAGGVP